MRGVQVHFTGNGISEISRYHPSLSTFLCHSLPSLVSQPSGSLLAQRISTLLLRVITGSRLFKEGRGKERKKGNRIDLTLFMFYVYSWNRFETKFFYSVRCARFRLLDEDGGQRLQKREIQNLLLVIYTIKFVVVVLVLLFIFDPYPYPIFQSSREFP